LTQRRAHKTIDLIGVLEMAIGYHRLNSSAARSKINSGRAEKGVESGAGVMPEWMTRKALLRPGDRVKSDFFGVGVVVDFALTEFSPVIVMFDCGEKTVTYRSISKV